MARKRKIGKMRHRIDILSVDDAPFGTHSLKRTTSVVASRWSEMTEYTLAQRSNRGIGENITHRFIIREGVALDNNSLIRFEGKLYKVENVEPMGSDPDDMRRTFIGIYCEYQGTEEAYEDPSPEITEVVLVSLSIVGSDIADSESTEQYTLVGTYSDDSTKDHTADAIWNESSGLTTIDGGLLTIGHVSGNSAVTIFSSYKGLSTTKDITLQADGITLQSLEIQGLDSIAFNTANEYTLIGHYSDASEVDHTADAVWTEDSQYTSMIGNMLFCSPDAASYSAILVAVSFGGLAEVKSILINPGVEELVNNDFSTGDLTGWSNYNTPYPTVVGTDLVFDQVTGNGGIMQKFNDDRSTSYLISIVIKSKLSTYGPTLNVNNGASELRSGNVGSNVGIVTTTGGESWSMLRTSYTDVRATIESVSVREVIPSPVSYDGRLNRIWENDPESDGELITDEQYTTAAQAAHDGLTALGWTLTDGGHAE